MSMKVGLLMDYCRKSVKFVNGSKTKFMVIRGEERLCFLSEWMEYMSNTSYVYLGIVFTQPQSAVKEHQRRS